MASVMGRYFGLGILRRYSTLSTLNLLYLQAELNDLAQSDVEYGAAGDMRRGFFAQDRRHLSDARGDGNKKEWEKMLQVREKLKEYCKS